MRQSPVAAVLALAALALAWAPAHAQDAIPIAVLDLTGHGIGDGELRMLSDRLRVELFKTGHYQVMEREQMKAVLDEQGFQQTKCVATECVVEVGQLVGVRKMIAGNVGKIGRVYSITVRLIDVESGALEETAVQDCQCLLEDVLTRQMAVSYTHLTLPTN